MSVGGLGRHLSLDIKHTCLAKRRVEAFLSSSSSVLISLSLSTWSGIRETLLTGPFICLSHGLVVTTVLLSVSDSACHPSMGGGARDISSVSRGTEVRWPCYWANEPFSS